MRCSHLLTLLMCVRVVRWSERRTQDVPRDSCRRGDEWREYKPTFLSQSILSFRSNDRTVSRLHEHVATSGIDPSCVKKLGMRQREPEFRKTSDSACKTHAARDAVGTTPPTMDGAVSQENKPWGCCHELNMMAPRCGAGRAATSKGKELMLGDIL
ncbi:hypothetical protein Sjap_002509 [Stephania japonica]|uniref:Secreted protein n=1 Tax=Stephania japonica TaxID=461633 RepID=A0AAP0KNS2_9MAGN